MLLCFVNMDERIFCSFLILALLKQTLQAPLPDSPQDKQFMAVSVCRGGRRTIACPKLQLLHIFTAFYGKMSGQDCDDPIASPRSRIPTCSSKNAAQVIRNECHGQQSCDLYSEDSLYDNPCPEVLKYLFVSYTCQGKADVLGKLRSMSSGAIMPQQQPQSRQLQPQQPFASLQPLQPQVIALPISGSTPLGPLAVPIISTPPQAPDIQTTSVCAGKKGSIVCPDLKIIRIHGAFFGQQSGRDCLGRLKRDEIPTCFAPYAITTVRDVCQGQQSCDLYTEPSLYGRSSCPLSDKKYLSVSYSCIGHSNLQRHLQMMEQRGKSAWPAMNTAQYAPSAYPQYNAYTQQWYQQARARSMAPKPATRYPYYPKPNPSIYQRPAARQMQPAYQPAQYNPAMNQQFNSFNAFTTSPSCDMCNGDCNNWACFGCGGCETPQAVQQTFTYPYQRQDAAFHDSFTGHEMALSGMVLWPVPKLPKEMRKRNPPKTRSETYEEEADDASGSGDDEDDEDDER